MVPMNKEKPDSSHEEETPQTPLGEEMENRLHQLTDEIRDEEKKTKDKVDILQKIIEATLKTLKKF
jgi:hypothetical protein